MECIFPESRYEYIRNIGRGSTSNVVLARHKALGTIRAIKIIPKTEENKNCYNVEINVLNIIRLDGVPIIYDVEEDENYWYIVEEYIDGVTFSEYLYSEGAEAKKAILYLCELCTILESLHNAKPYGIIYGDLKPENIVISDDKLYLVDFGNCAVVESGVSTDMATKGYASPEQIYGNIKDVASDVYSIGVLLQKVYRRFLNSFESRKSDILKIISICLMKEPGLRYSSAKMVGNQLGYLLKMDSRCALGNNIYIFGCRRYAGVSHFAMGLCKYLSENSYDARYIEKCGHRDVKDMFNTNGASDVIDGIIKYKGCKLIPDYGDFVINEKEETAEKYSVNIYDCGEYNGTVNSLNGKVIIIITDIKDYKRFKYTDCLKYKDDINVMYVGNFCDVKGIVEIKRKYGINIYDMPYFNNPFEMGSSQKEFYKKLSGKMFGMDMQRKKFLRNG